MAGNRTFTIIKPNAVGNRHVGDVCTMIEQAGFRIVAMKMIYFSRNDAERFYSEHRGRSYFRNIYLFMTSGPSVVMVLEKDNAVADYRKLVGPTNPALTEEGTIRNRYAESKTRNAIHSSDSDENAEKEIAFFFTESEIMVGDYVLPIPTDEIDSD